MKSNQTLYKLLERGAVVGAKDKNGQGLDWDDSFVADLMERKWC